MNTFEYSTMFLPGEIFLYPAWSMSFLWVSDPALHTTCWLDRPWVGYLRHPQWDMDDMDDMDDIEAEKSTEHTLTY